MQPQTKPKDNWKFPHGGEYEMRCHSGTCTLKITDPIEYFRAKNQKYNFKAIKRPSIPAYRFTSKK